MLRDELGWVFWLISGEDCEDSLSGSRHTSLMILPWIEALLWWPYLTIGIGLFLVISWVKEVEWVHEVYSLIEEGIYVEPLWQLQVIDCLNMCYRIDYCIWFLLECLAGEWVEETAVSVQGLPRLHLWLRGGARARCLRQGQPLSPRHLSLSFTWSTIMTYYVVWIC